jgi:phosphatidylinositol kinase/protein kinase (PI-3  family)
VFDCADIDFGHFLGNFKKKFGFNRERSAFVFTPEMAFVMGGSKYKQSPLFKTFRDLCFKAFNALRKHADTLENLFLLVSGRWSSNTEQARMNRSCNVLTRALLLERVLLFVSVVVRWCPPACPN